MNKIKLTWWNEDGEETTYEFPAINEVCDRCEGFGTHLTPSIGLHAYSTGEFNESFDEDEKYEYFRRGGIYDVSCEVCNGKNVVVIVSENLLNEEEKTLYAQYQICEERIERYRAEDDVVRRMENGWRG